MKKKRGSLFGLPLRAWVGGSLVAIGALLSVAVAVLGSRHTPPSASIQGLLAFVAIVIQVAAASTFARLGRADPALARSAASRLLRLARRAVEARQLAEGIAEQQGGPQAHKAAAGRLSVHLSYLEEGFVESVEDWRSFHPDAVGIAERNTLVDDE